MVLWYLVVHKKASIKKRIKESEQQHKVRDMIYSLSGKYFNLLPLSWRSFSIYCYFPLRFVAVFFHSTNTQYNIFPADIQRALFYSVVGLQYCWKCFASKRAHFNIFGEDTSNEMKYENKHTSLTIRWKSGNLICTVIGSHNWNWI